MEVHKGKRLTLERRGNRLSVVTGGTETVRSQVPTNTLAELVVVG